MFLDSPQPSRDPSSGDPAAEGLGRLARSGGGRGDTVGFLGLKEAMCLQVWRTARTSVYLEPSKREREARELTGEPPKPA